MTPPQDEHGDGFDPQRLRTLTDMRRSREDKMVAGVCAGVGRHLDIDPVIVRVLLATLTFFGLAGIIVYVAVWVLIPEEGADESIAGRTFKLGENEEQFRTVGLIVTAIIAIVAASNVVGGNAFDTPFPYIAIIALFFLWWFVIRPHQRDQKRQSDPAGGAVAPAHGAVPARMTAPMTTSVMGRTSTAATAPITGTGAGQSSPPVYGPPPPGAYGPPPYYPLPRRNPRHDHGALTALTFFTAVAAVGGVWAYALATDSGHLPVFLSLAVALGVLGAGMLLGAVVGNGRPLVPLVVVTALALSLSAALPTTSIGQETPTPVAAAQVRSTYDLGIGDMRVDLSRVADPDALDGRTVTVKEGIGSMHVIVPTGVDVDVDARTRGGEVRMFGKAHDGQQVSVRYVDPVDDGPDVHLVLEQTFGNIEVTRG